MKGTTLLKSGFLAMATLALTTSSVQADVITLTSGSPAPSLSPVLNYDVNFDNIATGTLITPALYASAGIASITNAGLPLFTFAGTESLPNYVGTGPTDGWAMDTTIVFNGLQNILGFGDAGPNTTTVTAFDASGASLFTSTFASATNAYWVVDDLTGTNIQSIEISSSFIAIDDVQFNNLSSPEPSAMLMLATAILALSFIAWRRRSGRLLS